MKATPFKLTCHATCWLLALLFAGMAVKSSATDVAAVRDRLKNDPLMIPFHTGKILPFPREASYHDDYFPLANAGLLLGGDLAADDPRLKLLRDRIVRYGGALKLVDSVDNDCATVLVVGKTAVVEMPVVPDQPQGYAIRCFKQAGKNIVAFAGHDRLGLTWAVNSLIQMITLRDDITVLHAVDVSDYPFIRGRGTLGPGVHDYVAASRIYPVMTKLDKIHFTKSLLVPRRRAPMDWIDWRAPRPQELTDKIAAIGANLQGLGIEWNVGIMPYTIGNGIEAKYGLIQVDSKGDAHFDIIWKMCEPILRAGGGIAYTPDDYRFPLSPEDEKNFGTARDADVYFMNRLYARIKASYPDAHLSMVQPFYWGPTSTNPWSTESPIEYLKALGEKLPPDVNLAWTGPSVKTAGFTRDDAGKFAALIKRKPFFFQNSSDTRHVNRHIYLTDTLKWWLGAGRDRDVYHEFKGVSYNSGGLYPDMLWSAMLWNPDGYDAAAAARDATCKLVGMENYDLARRIAEGLAWFDQFDLSPTPAAAIRLPEIEAKLAELQVLHDEFENNTDYPAAARQWGAFGGGMRAMQRFHAAITNNKALVMFADRISATESVAKAESAFQPETDRVFTAFDWTGGRKPKRIFDRMATWVYGARSRAPQMELAFEVDPYPPETGYVLRICGRDGGAGVNCAIEITLNGETIFSGANPFSRDAWGVRPFDVPLPALQRNNVLAIANIEDCAQSGRPYFALNYLVLRKEGGDR